MDGPKQTERQRLRAVLDATPIVRAYELRRAGVDGKTISRAVRDGDLLRIARGLYQRPDSEIDTEQSLAEAIKRVPRGVIAMVSALAFHGLTDQIPRKVWVAISARDWGKPAPSYPPIRIVELREKYMDQGVEYHRISGIDVPIFSIPKTLADVFRRRIVDRSVAVEGLRAALDQRKATPSEIADAAKAADSWKALRPYLEAMTSNG